MADNEEGKQTSFRGNEWEVVSLTASAYAAAPGPKGVELKADDKEKTFEVDEVETSRALFMSGHFTFPPAQHENLPLETDNVEVEKEHKGEGMVSEANLEEGGRSTGKGKEDWDIKGLSAADEFSGMKFDDETAGLDARTALHGLNLVGTKQDLYSAAKFSSFPGETTVGGSTVCEEKMETIDSTYTSEQGLDDIADIPHPKPTKDESNLPCEAWWKRQAASFYAHAKEANVLWSIFIAAAVMGLVVVGKRWQRERLQALQLKWQLSVNNEKPSRMVDPLSGLKDVVIGGNRRSSFVTSSLSG